MRKWLGIGEGLKRRDKEGRGRMGGREERD